MSLIDFGEKVREGHGVVTSKGPGCSRCGYRDGDGTEECDDDDEEGQRKGSSRCSHNLQVDVGKCLSDRRIEEIS